VAIRRGTAETHCLESQGLNGERKKNKRYCCSCRT